MDAVASIGHRIGEITSLIASLDRTARVVAPSPTPAPVNAGSSSDAFATALAQATEGTDTLASAASAVNADGIPLALVGYGNGRIPEAQLVPVADGSDRMWAPAAAQLDRLRADAKAAGHTISLNDGYRSYDDQVRTAERLGLRSQGGLAAAPGTSNHGWGIAADLSLNDASRAWMRENAQRYGFVSTISDEPWHWEFRPAR